MRFRLLIALLCLTCLFSTPALAALRFQDCGDGTVADTATNLLWLKNTSCTATVGGVTPPYANSGNNYMPWASAVIWSNGMANGACGLSDGSKAGDWHLPTIDELISLICGNGAPAWQNNGCDGSNTYNPNGAYPYLWLQSQGLSAVQYIYWSSSTYAPNPYSAWSVDMREGVVYYWDKTYTYFVWPVRGGQCDNSVISGTVTNTDSDPEAAPLSNATVTIDGQTYTTDSSGKFNSGKLKKGNYTVAVAKSGFDSQSATVTMNDTPVTQDFSLVPKPITVNELKSDKYQDARYYLPQIDLTLNFTSTIDWNGHDPGKVKFITSSVTKAVATKNSTAQNTINIGKYINPCETLKVVAIAADGDNTKSAEKKAEFLVTQPLPNITISKIDITDINGGSSFKYTSEEKLNMPLIDQIVADGFIKDMPVFGLKKFGLGFSPDMSFELDSSTGKGKFTDKWANILPDSIKDKLKTAYSDRTQQHGLANLTNTMNHFLHTGELDGGNFPKTYIAGFEATFFPEMKGESHFDSLSCSNGSAPWSTDSFSLGVAGQGQWTFVRQFPPLPTFPWVPWYVKGSIGIDADLLLNITDLFKGELSGGSAINPKVMGAIGAGVNEIAALEGLLNGGIDSDWLWPGGMKTANVYIEVAGKAYVLVWNWQTTSYRWEQCLVGCS